MQFKTATYSTVSPEITNRFYTAGLMNPEGLSAFRDWWSDPEYSLSEGAILSEAIEDDVPVGIALINFKTRLYLCGNEAEFVNSEVRLIGLFSIFIAPAYRNRGLGRVMTQAIEHEYFETNRGDGLKVVAASTSGMRLCVKNFTRLGMFPINVRTYGAKQDLAFIVLPGDENGLDVVVKAEKEKYDRLYSRRFSHA